MNKVERKVTCRTDAFWSRGTKKGGKDAKEAKDELRGRWEGGERWGHRPHRVEGKDCWPDPLASQERREPSYWAPNAPGLHDPKSIELRKSFGITFINSFEYHLYIVPEGIVNSQKMHMHICLCQKYPQMQLSSFETHILSLIVSLWKLNINIKFLFDDGENLYIKLIPILFLTQNMSIPNIILSQEVSVNLQGVKCSSDTTALNYVKWHTSGVNMNKKSKYGLLVLY